MNVRSEKSRISSGNVRLIRPASSTTTTPRRTRLRRRAKATEPKARPAKAEKRESPPAFAPTTHPDIDNEAVYLTVKETAKLLRTTPRAIYSMMHRGQLPGVRRLGRRVLIVRKELIHWIDTCNAYVGGPVP